MTDKIVVTEIYDHDETKDVTYVTAITEKILRCLTFRVLEKVIDRESEEGVLNVSAIPQRIIDELKLAKSHNYSQEVSNNVDKWFLDRIVSALEAQVEFAVDNYHPRFHKLTSQLMLQDEFSFAYNSFVKICKRLFTNEICWNRILALLCFGSEIAVYIIRQGKAGVESFVNKIVHFVVEFVVKEEIANWIAIHGGWMALIDILDSPQCPDRANHILTIMAFSELTHVEVWFQRLATVAVVLGVCVSIKKLLSS